MRVVHFASEPRKDKRFVVSLSVLAPLITDALLEQLLPRGGEFSVFVSSISSRE